MKITKVDEGNIADAGRIHSESWKESHRSFCSAEFVEKHTPAAQVDFLRREMNTGKTIYMLIDNYPVGIVSVYGSLIENLYVLPQTVKRLDHVCLIYRIKTASSIQHKVRVGERLCIQYGALCPPYSLGQNGYFALFVGKKSKEHILV